MSRLSHTILERHSSGFLRSLRRRRPETRGTYERALREFFRWCSQESRLRLHVNDIERYKHHLTAKRRLSPASVSTYLTAVRRFCGYLVRIGLLRGNPAIEVEGNSRPRAHSRVPLTAGQVERLVRVLDRTDERGLRDAAIIRLMLECGLSEIEIIRADVCDLSGISGAVRLAVQGKGHTKKDTSVLLAPEAKESIDRYLAARGDVTSSDPLFASAGNRTRGERMTTRGVRDRVNFYLELAGTRQRSNSRVTPYSLRHTAAMLMAEQGASADEIRQRMRLGTQETANLYIARQWHIHSAR